MNKAKQFLNFIESNFKPGDKVIVTGRYSNKDFKDKIISELGEIIGVGKYTALVRFDNSIANYFTKDRWKQFIDHFNKLTNWNMKKALTNNDMGYVDEISNSKIRKVT